MNPYVRAFVFVLASPIIAIAIAFCLLLALTVIFVDLIESALENRKPNSPLDVFFCTCKIAGGPAGDYKHHDRQCLYARLAARRHKAHEDPQTGWVTIG